MIGPCLLECALHMNLLFQCLHSHTQWPMPNTWQILVMAIHHHYTHTHTHARTHTHTHCRFPNACDIDHYD